MQTVKLINALRSTVAQWRRERLSIALVPTMGNLHAGHLSLVEKALQTSDRTVATVFVNPTQFVAGEDYERYPRTLEQDSLKLSEMGVQLLFIPEVEEMFPAGPDKETRVEPPLQDVLCGAFRPGHFTGVATVVVKLLNMVQPDIAVFGEKDYQQLLVIRRLVADLCMPVDIVAVPTVREDDGLAMSSRNAYLSGLEREQAPTLYRTLCRIRDQILQGRRDFQALEGEGRSALEAAGFRLDYLSIRRAADLSDPGAQDRELAVLAAAWLGSARLIDNVRTADGPAKAGARPRRERRSA